MMWERRRSIASRCGILAAIRRHLTQIIRAGEWWEYKLVPIFSVFYATAVVLHVSVASLWAAALTILLSMVPGAAYVSVINDLTDRAEDLAAGKANRLVGSSPIVIAALLTLTIAAGLAFSWYWRKDALLLSCYLAAWLAFSLYSLPPFRLKARGALGVLCDASGAHLFPTLVAAIVTCRAAGHAVSVPWIASVAVWAFAYGLRGILWHQLTDRENDRAAGVRTFAQRHSPHAVTRLGTFVVFPLELAGLTAILWQLRSSAAVLLLGLYAILAIRRIRRWNMQPVVVAPRSRFFIVLHEYYDVFFPIALLLTSSLAYRLDLVVLGLHLLLFSGRPRQTGRDLSKMAAESLATAGAAFDTILRPLVPLPWRNEIRIALGRHPKQLQRRFPAIEKVALSRSAVVVDAGANRGDFTECVLAYRPHARVYAFEPLDAAFHTLAERMRPFANVTTENVALGRTKGTETLKVRAIDQASSFFDNGVVLDAGLDGHDFSVTASIPVPVVTLGAYVEERQLETIELLKLDVQGYELEVLSGGDEVLDRVKWIYTEAHLEELYRGAPRADDIIRYLGERHFALIERSTLRLDDAGRPIECDLLFRREPNHVAASRAS